MAQEREDQAARDAELALAVGQTVQDSADHVPNRNAAIRVRLGIEERLDVADTVRVGAREVRQRQLAEVLAGNEHGAGGVVDVEERLQVGKVVGGPHLLDRADRERDAVAGGQPDGQLRFERPLQVDVQLDLGQTVDQASRSPWSLALTSACTPLRTSGGRRSNR
jgi:hypothetical protein